MKIKIERQDEAVLAVEHIGIQSVSELYMALSACQLYVASHPDVWFSSDSMAEQAEAITIEEENKVQAYA